MIKMIPKQHLENMGFLEISKGLFMKYKGDGIKIYRDYREGKSSYAYQNKTRVPTAMFKELSSIEKIENFVNNNKLSAYS